MARIIAAPNLQLPWSSTTDDDRRYWKTFGVLLIPFFIFSIIIPMVNIPEPDREELERLPPQLAKVVLEKKELPTPVPTPKPTPKPEEKKEPEKKEPKKEEPKKEEPKPEPKKEPDPVKLVDKAREEAQAEISQFADQLSELRDSFDLSEVNAEVTQSTGEAAKLSRDIISSGAKRGSGGINTSNLSRDTGGVAVSAKKTTAAVQSKLKAGEGNKPKVARTSADRSTRSREEIRKVMDQNKAAIYAIYNRALRKNPALEGKVVFKLEINGNGQVVAASIVSSDLQDAALERKLLARIRLINFGAKDVLKTTLNYNMDFLPY